MRFNNFPVLISRQSIFWFYVDDYVDRDLASFDDVECGGVLVLIENDIRRVKPLLLQQIVEF